VIDLNVRIPQEIIDGWMHLDPRFRNTWERRRHDLKDQSNSGYDMALACFWRRCRSPRAAHRGPNDPPPCAPQPKAEHPGGLLPEDNCEGEGDRPGRATGRARCAPGDAPADDTIPPGAAPTLANAILCCKISRCLGVTVLRLVKFEGKDPTYHMHLEQGVIEFTNVDRLITYASVRSAIAAKVGQIIPGIKPKEWAQIAQMMLDACFGRGMHGGGGLPGRRVESFVRLPPGDGLHSRHRGTAGAGPAQANDR